MADPTTDDALDLDVVEEHAREAATAMEWWRTHGGAAGVTYVARSAEDVPVLVAEIRRLRAQRDAAKAQIDRDCGGAEYLSLQARQLYAALGLTPAERPWRPITDLVGLDPDMTGGLSVDDHLHRMRSGCDHAERVRELEQRLSGVVEMCQTVNGAHLYDELYSASATVLADDIARYLTFGAEMAQEGTQDRAGAPNGPNVGTSRGGGPEGQSGAVEGDGGEAAQ